MLRHILKLIWNKKASNAMLLLEMFLAFFVLFGGFTAIIYNLRNVSLPLGFETKDIWEINLERQENPDSAATAELNTRLIAALRDLPAVQEASFCGTFRPYGRSCWTNSNDEAGFNIRVDMAQAGGALAKTLGMKLNSGRWFRDDEPSPAIEEIVVNQDFVDKYFDGKNIVDSIIRFSGEKRIIGVVQDYRYFGEFRPSTPVMFNYMHPTDKENTNIYLRMTPGTPASYEREVTRLVKDITQTTGFVIQNLDNLRQADSKTNWVGLMSVLILCVFLCLNVALGLFGVLWYNIQKRRAEVGLRRAIGATSGEISQQIIMETLVLAFFSILLGLIFAVQVPLLKVVDLPVSNFYWAMLATTTVMTLLVLICAYYPSRQAAAIQPALALHED